MNHSTQSARLGKYVVFRCAGQSYAFPIAFVEEIIPMAEVAAVPTAPAFLTGFLDVGGEPVAVISLNRLLEVPRAEPELYSPLILLKEISPRLAIEVDEVLRIVELNEEELTSIMDDCSFNDCAAAAARVDNQTILVIAPDKLLLEQERRRVAELAATTMRRLDALTPAEACS